MRALVVCVLFALSLAACGGAGSSSTLPFGAPDVLAFAPGTTAGVVSIEFDVLRDTPSVYGPLSTAFESDGLELVIVERCASAFVVFDEFDDGWSVLFDCQGLSSTDLDAVVAATFGPTDPVHVDRSGILVAGAMARRMYESDLIRPATRASAAVTGMRDLRRRRDRTAMFRGSYVVSEATRRRVAGMGEEPTERELMTQLARSLRDVRGVVAVEDDAIAWSVTIGTPDENGAGLVAGFATIMGDVARGTADDAEASDRLFGQLFGDAEIERDGSTVRIAGVTSNLAALFALVGEMAERPEAPTESNEPPSAEPVGDRPRATHGSRSGRGGSVGRGSGGSVEIPDATANIARLEPLRDDLVARFPDDARTLIDLDVLFSAYFSVGRTTDVLASIDAIRSSAAQRGLPLDRFEEFFLHDFAARARALRGNLDVAIAECDAAIAVAESPATVAAVHQMRAFALAELGRLDEANQAFDHVYPPNVRLPTTVDEAVNADQNAFDLWLTVENNRAWIAFLANRPADGLPRIEAVLAAVSRRPVSARRRAIFVNTHANLLFAAGRFEEAAIAHRDELALSGDVHLIDDPRRAISLYSMSRVEATLHHGEKAVRYARTAAELLDRTRSRAHPETALAHLRLAQALAENGAAAEAHTEAVLAVELFRSSCDPVSTSRREAEAFLAAHP